MSTLEALKQIIDKQTNENNQLKTELSQLKQLYHQYHQYDEYSNKMLDNVQILNQTKLAIANHQSLPEQNSLENPMGNALDIDQFEQLSTLLLHKMLHLPLVDMKTKHLHKPEKK